jgi:hypothetical protein
MVAAKLRDHWDDSGIEKDADRNFFIDPQI